MKKIFSIILLISFLFQGYAYAQPPMFAGGAGDLVGPASSTDNTIPRFDSTTGKLLQTSEITVDDSNNLIGLASLGINTGAALPVTKLQVIETITTSPRGIMSSQYNIGVDGARFHMRKGRGTLAAPTTIVTGDLLGRLIASGYDGANYLEMAGIDFGTSGTIAATRVPTYLAFLTATDATPSVLTERMRIDNTNKVTLWDYRTDASNYEGYSLDAGVTTADTLTIAGVSAGTGAANLNIAITPKGTGHITVPAGLVATPSIVSDDADSGFYFGSKGFNWGVDGVSKFSVSNNGTLTTGYTIYSGGHIGLGSNGILTSAGDNNTLLFQNKNFTVADNMIEMAYGTATFTGFDGEIIGVKIMPTVGVLDDGDTMTLLKLSPIGTPASTLGILNGLAFGNWGGTGTDSAYMLNLSATGYDYLIYDNNFSVTDAGQGYFAGNVGIGLTPGTKLDIADDSIDAGFRIRHTNLSQGISIGYNTILANGTGANLDINVTSKGTGAVKLSKTAMSNSAVSCAATVCTDVPESYAIYLTTTGTDTMTIADGTNAGQEKYISHKVDGGQVTITPTNFSGGTNIVLTAAGDNVKLHWNGTKWDILSTYRGTVN